MNALFINLALLILCCSCDDGSSPTPQGAGEESGASTGEEAGEDAGEKSGEIAGAGAEAGVPAGVTAGDVVSPEPPSGLELSAPVRVRFDEVSGLHLTCARVEDCFVAQGYYHAAHRFTQMDLNRLFPQGRLTERIGNLALDVDRQNRLIFSRRDGARIEQQMWDASTEESKRMLTAYARGVNAWLARWRMGDPNAKLSEEYDVSIFDPSTIEDWTPQDSLSVALVLIQDLTESSRSQLGAAARLTEVGPELYQDLFGAAPAFPTAVLSGAQGVEAVAPEITGLDEDKSDESATAEEFESMMTERYASTRDLYERLQPYAAALNLPHLEALQSWRARPEEERNPLGSNNWVIAPERAASESAWLSNDPHLGLSNPSVWYLTHIKVEPTEDESRAELSLNVSGVSLPGIPSVVIGQNEHIAWGMTTTYFDFNDVYIDPLNDTGDAVLFEGSEVDFIRREDRFILAGSNEEVVEESLFVPHHGPVLNLDTARGVAVTMRWTAQDADTDVNFLLKLARAADVNEAREAIKSVTTIGQNFVVADDQGHIGWFPYNRLPRRAWASVELDPSFPLPGDGSAEWGEPIPYDELPQQLDPERGFIVTANHDMTGAFSDGDATDDAEMGGPASALQQRPAHGYRYSQSTRLVARDEPHDRASLTEAIHDRESLLARRLLPAIIGAIDISALTESGQRLVGVLSAWGEGPRGYDCPSGLSSIELDQAMPSADPRERADSAGCFAFHVLYGYLSELVFSDELAKVSDRELFAEYEALARLIARPELLLGGVSYWDDVSTATEEDAGLTIAEAINRAGSYFNREYGPDTETWLWGSVHTVTTVAAVLSDAGLKSYDNGPYPNHGGLYTVDVANPRSMYRREFSHGSGASMRFVCELTSPPSCQIEIPGGQRHHRDSPHYDDLLRGWLNREPTLIPFTDEAVEASTIEEVMFSEALFSESVPSESVSEE